MSSVHQRITWRRNIAENFNPLSRVHERYRRQTDGRKQMMALRPRDQHVWDARPFTSWDRGRDQDQLLWDRDRDQEWFRSLFVYQVARRMSEDFTKRCGTFFLLSIHRAQQPRSGRPSKYVCRRFSFNDWLIDLAHLSPDFHSGINKCEIWPCFQRHSN